MRSRRLDKLVVEGTVARGGAGRGRAASPAPPRALLAAERTALNFLGHLSGVATLTARFVEAARARRGRAAILDTRKTTPGLRALEKAAVLAGGGSNHRIGLYDAILIKENHIALAGGLAKAVARARNAQPELAVEVECRELDEVAYALGTGADRLLLDNMDLDALREAVAARDDAGAGGGRSRPPAASTSTPSRAIAETGVDFISVGALTHSAPTLDFSAARGRSYLSSLESRRSLSTLPPVCSSGQ